MKRRIANPLFMMFLFFVSADELVAQSDLLTRTDSVQMPFTIASETFAVWSGGALVYVQDRFSSAPIIQVFDRTGSEISKFTFSIPRANLINLL